MGGPAASRSDCLGGQLCWPIAWEAAFGGRLLRGLVAVLALRASTGHKASTIKYWPYGPVLAVGQLLVLALRASNGLWPVPLVLALRASTGPWPVRSTGPTGQYWHSGQYVVLALRASTVYLSMGQDVVLALRASTVYL